MWFMVKNLYREEYRPIWLAKFIHNWPHISYKTFTKKDADFAPDDEEYVETLLFWAGMPIVWLGVCIVALLLFSCCLCMKRNQPVSIRKRITRLKWWLIFTILLCVGAIGVCFYGNSTSATGIHHYINAVEEANSTLADIHSEVTSVNNEMRSAGITTQDLQREFSSCTNNQTAKATLDRLSQEIQDATMHITSNITKIQEKLDGDLIDSLLQSSSSIRQYHFWGWSIFIGLLLLDLLLCLYVIFCTGKLIRGGIILGCILLIIAFTLVWIMTGAELFVAVGLSDLCFNPNPYMLHEGSKHGLEEDVVKYYIECRQTTSDPFEKMFADSQRDLLQVQNNKDQISKLCSKSEAAKAILNDLQEILDSSTKGFNQLHVSANCQQLNGEYKLAIFGLCYNGLSGLGFQLLCGTILGMLWLVAICQGTLLASRLGRRKMNYDADQEDPFLPPREGTATLERYSARRDQASTSGLSRRPISSTSQSSNALPHFPVIISNRGSSLVSQSNNVSVPDDLPPSYTLAISRDRPNQRNGNRQSSETSDNRYSAASLV